MQLYDELFEGVTFADVLQDIYKNSKSKKKQIEALINELRGYIKSASDALVIVPLIADYLDISIKNDDQLVKMANVIAKSFGQGNNDGGGELGLSPEEIKQLRENAVNTIETISVLNEKKSEILKDI